MHLFRIFTMYVNYILVLTLSIAIHKQVTSEEVCDNLHPCRFEVNELLRHPQQIRSKYGKLQINLTVEMARVTVGGWLQLWRRTYNGDIGGPTLRARPGDNIQINLINKLGKNVAGSLHNSLGLANSTNLYFHGIHSSPEGSGNNMLRVAEPGELLKYNFTIDCHQPTGTFWYHPQTHGSTLFQTHSGMAGMIVVEDSPQNSDGFSTLSNISCPRHCEHEIDLLFQPTLFYNSESNKQNFAQLQEEINDDILFRNREITNVRQTLQEWLTSPDNKVQHFTTNGQIQPVIKIQSSQMKRMRLVNAGGIHSLNIVDPFSKKGDKCDVYEIARDGVYFKRPKQPQGGSMLLPGGRVDWILQCNEPGTYKLMSSHSNGGKDTSNPVQVANTLLATIHVVETKAIREQNVPRILPKLPEFMNDLRQVKQRKVGGRFVVEASGENILNRGRLPHPSDVHIRHYMHLDDIQEWTILNTDPVKSHVLHISGIHFQITSVNKYNGPISVELNGKLTLLDQNGYICEQQFSVEEDVSQQTQERNMQSNLPNENHKKSALSASGNGYGYGYDEIGQWMDVILIPTLSNITIRFRPHHFYGHVMVQSQNFYEKDLGMMMFTKVIPKGSVYAEATPAVSGSYPGACHQTDFYPTPNSRKAKIQPFYVSENTFKNFFYWLYEYRPSYMHKYGDQSYLSQLYVTYLRNKRKRFSTGDHLKDFFKWTYRHFPTYKSYYGDQSYLYELYSYYLERQAKHLTSISQTSLE